MQDGTTKNGNPIRTRDLIRTIHNCCCCCALRASAVTAVTAVTTVTIGTTVAVTNASSDDQPL